MSMVLAQPKDLAMIGKRAATLAVKAVKGEKKKKEKKKLTPHQRNQIAEVEAMSGRGLKKKTGTLVVRTRGLPPMGRALDSRKEGANILGFSPGASLNDIPERFKYLKTSCDPCDLTLSGIPDDVSTPSMKFKTVNTFSITTTSDGYINIIVIPNPQSFAISATSEGYTDDFDAAHSPITGFTALSPQVSSIRPVSGCLTVVIVDAPMVVSGIVYLICIQKYS